MSDREPDMALRNLPQPKSPQALDERILAAAREQAPAPRQQRSLTWMGGLASACVLVLGVMLTGVLTTLPYRTTEQPDDLEVSAVMLAKDTRHAASYGKVAARPMLDRDKQFRRQSPPAGDVPTAEVPAASAGVSSGLAADAAAIQGGKPKPSAPLAMDSAVIAPRNALVESEAVSILSPEEQADDLRFCEQFLKEEQAGLAQRCYALLLDRCQQCDLPDTLEAALEALASREK